MEYQTGLIFPTPPSNDVEVLKIIPSDSRTLSPRIVEALQALRESNPSFKRKLDHGIVIDPESDDKLAYWNRMQDVLIVDNSDSSSESEEAVKITGLNLGGIMVRIIDCVPFFQCLHDHQISIQMVNFGGTDIPMNNLLTGLQKLTCPIDALFLGGCGIASMKGVDDLARILELPMCLGVTKLDLRYNDLSGEAMTKLMPTLSSNDSKLDILHLEGNSLKHDGSKAIGTILSKTKSLRELYLGGNSISADGAKSLAEGLGQNLSVQKLYLEGNAIGDEGADAFRKVLIDQTENKSKVLKHLYVENNGMGKEAAMKLGRALNSENLVEGSLFQ